MNRYPSCDKQIGLNLAYQRKLRGLDQAAIAKHLQIARTAVSAIEHGRRQLSLAEAIVLHEHAGITWSNLTEGTPIRF